MGQIRKPFQGVTNIVKFNWHFYVITFLLIGIILISAKYLAEQYLNYAIIVCVIITGTLIITLLVSFYIYDASGLYKLNWLNEINICANSKIVNIHAGFDETSSLLSEKYAKSELIVYDFYDPLKHTEVSIKRARKAYPSYSGTKHIVTENVPLPEDYADIVFLIFAAHEIRNEKRENKFF